MLVDALLAIAIIAPVLALLLKPDSGLYLLIAGEADFQPPSTLTNTALFGAFGGLFLLFVGYVAAGQLKELHTEHLKQKFEASQTPQQKRISAYQDDKYKFVANLEFADSSETPNPTVVTVLARPEYQDDDGITTVTGAIVYPNGEATDLKVGALTQRSSWKSGDVQHFQGDGQSDGKPIADILGKEPMRFLASDADYVICFGLASNEEGDDPKMNDALADARAGNLCRAIRNLGLVQRDGTKVVALGVGQPDKIAVGEEERLLQRSAVIVAVTDAWRPMFEEDIALAATAMIKPQGINLKNYRRSSGRFSIEKNVKAGPYIDAQIRELPKTASRIIVEPRSGQQ